MKIKVPAIVVFFAATALLGQSQESNEHATDLEVKAMASIECEHWTNAEVLLKRAKRLDPSNAVIYQLLGDVNKQMGRLHRALKYYTHAESLNPTKSETTIQPYDRVVSRH